MLLKIGLNEAPSEDMQEIYLRLIEELTPSHVKILDFLWRGPARIMAAKHGALPPHMTYQQMIDQFEPEFRGQAELVQQVLNDLSRRGLSTLEKASHIFPMPVMTNQGTAFLQFVLFPEDLK